MHSYLADNLTSVQEERMESEQAEQFTWFAVRLLWYAAEDPEHITDIEESYGIVSSTQIAY